MKTGAQRSAGDECQAIMREKARTFALAVQWLPPNERRDVTAFYAFCRTIDDLVDERPRDVPIEAIRRQLNDWRRWLHNPVPEGDAIRQAFGETLQSRNLPVQPILDLIDGCESDLTRVAIHDSAELDRYCYAVAGTVGVSMAVLLGASQPEALGSAALLGSAMQRTNIIRDVAEDASRGRVYLPLDALNQAGVSPDDICASRFSPALKSVVQDQVRRARAEYAQGIEGIAYLPARMRLPILIAARLYEHILSKVEGQDFNVFRGRAMTGSAEKALLTVRYALTGGLSRHIA